MKLSVYSLVPAFALLLVSSCKPDEDTDLPYIILDGDNPYYIDSIGGTFSEPGYHSVDDVDGDLTGSVLVTYPLIQGDSARTYDAVYSVSDKSGNVFTTVRKITVRNSAWKLEGYFGRSNQVCDTTSDTLFSAVVVASLVNNDEFYIRNFGNLGISGEVLGTYDRSTGKITLPVPQLLADSSMLDYINADSSYAVLTNDTLNFQIFYTHSLNGMQENCRTYYRR